jgi:hypothetical protein
MHLVVSWRGMEQAETTLVSGLASSQLTLAWCLGFSLRLPIFFAPLREMNFSFGRISRKGAKALLKSQRKSN